jgi:hypothetical protein
MKWSYNVYSVTNGLKSVKTKMAVIFAGTSLIISGGAGLAATQSGISHAAPSSVVVTPTNMQGWTFVDDQNNSTATATGKMVVGPATPPLGVGSAQLTTANTSDGQALLTSAYAGTSLSQLTNLQYSSYQSGPTLAIALSFDIRYHPGDTGYQGRLVFEPYQNGAVTVGSGWQTWNPLNGKWWASKTTPAGSNGLCPQSNPCSWSDVMTNWPSASILGNVVFKAGSGWDAFTGNVDAFTIGVNGNDTTYNFEPYAVATSTDDCKNNGWRTVTDSNGNSFKNQGQCVSWVEHNVLMNGKPQNS